MGTPAVATCRALPRLVLLSANAGANWVTGRRLRRGAVDSVLTLRVLAALLPIKASLLDEYFSLSRRSASAAFLRCRRQKITKDARAPIAKITPMAMPALAPVVISLEADVSGETLLEEDADDALPSVGDEDLKVEEATARGTVLAKDVAGERMDDGMPVDELGAAAEVAAAIEESTGFESAWVG